MCANYQVHCSFGLCATLYQLWYRWCRTEWIDYVEVKKKKKKGERNMLNKKKKYTYSTIVLWVAQNTREEYEYNMRI